MPISLERKVQFPKLAISRAKWLMKIKEELGEDAYRELIKDMTDAQQRHPLQRAEIIMLVMIDLHIRPAVADAICTAAGIPDFEENQLQKMENTL